MRDATDDRLRCTALRRDGQPCRAFASTPDGRCVLHGPRAAELHKAGGAATSRANRSARLLPSRLVPILEGLERAFLGVESGVFDLKRAMTMATVALAIGRLFQIGESEQRLRDLEQSVAEWQRADRARWPA
jgi:hypothetical protein